MQPFYHTKPQSLDQIHHIQVEEQQQFDGHSVFIVPMITKATNNTFR
jgi:hypothetical protein